MVPEPAVWWLRLALGDIAAAELLVENTALPPRIAAYHAQQAAEKALKASIALDGAEPPFTHDLVYLLDIQSTDSGLQRVVSDIERLAKPHAAARYPSPDATEYDEDEVQVLVGDAALLVAAVERSFHERGVPATEIMPA